MKKKIFENNIATLMLIYLAAVIVYSVAACFMKVAPHVRVDEDLYLSLAKSFFKGTGFIVHGQISDYSCTLYSMLISPLYSFYSPATILLSVRIMNAFLMCSVVFPVYLLAGELLPQKYRMCITVFAVLIPDMVAIFYVMQEVLYYPLLMWCFYFILRDLKEEKINRYTICSILSLALLFCTKNVGLSFFIAYICTNIVVLLKRSWKKISIAIIIYAAFLLGWKYLIFILNGSVKGENHYTEQLSWLFPLSYRTFIAGIIGVIVYIIFYMLCMGIIPVFITFIGRNELQEDVRKLLTYTYVSAAMTILEIVGAIYLTEEHEYLIPHKFLFRYLFPLLVIHVMLMVNKSCSTDDQETNTRRSVKTVIAVTLFAFAGAAIYYLIVGPDARNSLLDSQVNLLLENGNKILSAAFAPAFLIISGIIAVILLTRLFRSGGNIIKTWCVTTAVLLAIFLPFNAFQHVYYSRNVVDGVRRESDFVRLAEYLGRDDENVYVIGRIHVPESMVFGYIYQDYILVEDIGSIDPEKGDVIVTSKGLLSSADGFTREGDYETIDVWTVL